jgi:hypothetical protein
MPGHGTAAETIFFPRTGYGGIILTNLKVIWEMSVQEVVWLAAILKQASSESHAIQEAMRGSRVVDIEISCPKLEVGHGGPNLMAGKDVLRWALPR